ncbi:MAG: helix-turn-helix domain-containing protein [Acidaminococcus provencensis]|jgi:DNA-binding transcriptional regulator YiaG|uniref:helix-turn-helix domain-containing protein n=1 Tax=Acidaminococcus provencensis TaxID=2058289 RepID=UPI00204DAB2C|nr:helix-turn-helix transcriptional regulator [Acidaminococcus provencensis]MCH4097299.1 helix-turn-helix domain-containing protein [Acidaminococcus provencensis]DAL57050.1 MAG TPA_asm: helix-turn-helix domain protein [Bacteriophage sp.]
MTTIKEARQAAGLSQQKMSDLLKIPKSTIEKWEMGIRKPPEWAAALIIEKLESMGGRKTAEK